MSSVDTATERDARRDTEQKGHEDTTWSMVPALLGSVDPDEQTFRGP